MAIVEIGGQIDADRVLLQYKCYEEYLDSLVTPTDLCYLRSTKTARLIAELGYRNSGETLTREAFHKRQKAANDYLYTIKKPYAMCSTGIDVVDPFLKELALRERANRVGMITTIVFLRHFTKQGYEISGYIDYAHRLQLDEWGPIFEGKKRIWPRTTDLGFYNWRAGTSFTTDSPNYQVVVDPDKGLLFQSRHDRKLICVDPYTSKIGDNTTKSRVLSDNYEHIVLYDHVLRRKAGLTG